ncbi:ATP-binding protein [Candidatus Woesearchaeota archaeon]|nr:ATP-binding protein [Candidatus Woesearchaeota archaeon]
MQQLSESITTKYTLLKLLAESHIIWEKILSVTQQKTNEWVYDLEVEDTHNFIANGFIVHNSQMLKRMTLVAPKARYVTGKGASGAGLSATVVKDEFLQGWSLEAGALVLANKGLCAIDEMDKMAKEDTWAMHEALEQQSVTISKANIQATLRCETTVLAAANPKFGRFDPYATIAEQINLPPTLINRFDLIFPIKDLPETTKDEKMAKFILNLHQHNTETPDIPTKLLRKYIAYARQKIIPKLTDGAIQELQEYYIKMRSSSAAQGVKSVPISARQLEGLVRMSEASAKLRLSDKVLKKDAKKSIELMDYCLRQVAFDEKTGTIDIDRIATEMPAAQRNKIVTIKEIIVELENKLGKTIPVEDVIKTASEKGMGESDVEEIIQKLKKAGDIFEPRHGFISRI